MCNKVSEVIGTLPEDYSKSSKEELDCFRAYISHFQWTKAKFFEDFALHKYILNVSCWKMKKDGKCKGECEPCKQREIGSFYS